MVDSSKGFSLIQCNSVFEARKHIGKSPYTFIYFSTPADIETTLVDMIQQAVAVWAGNSLNVPKYLSTNCTLILQKLSPIILRIDYAKPLLLN